MKKFILGMVMALVLSHSLLANAASPAQLLCQGAAFSSPLGLNGAVDYGSELHDTALQLSSPANGNAYAVVFYHYLSDSNRKETIALTSLLDSDFPRSTLLMSAQPLKAGLQDIPQYSLSFVEVRLAGDQRSAVLSYHYKFDGNGGDTAVSEARCGIDLAKTGQ